MSETLDKLRAAALALVEKETEWDPVPAVIEQMCRERAGKPITKRDVADLKTRIPGLEARIKKDDYIGVRIDYWTPVTLGGYDGDRRLPDDHPSANGYTGQRDASGEPVYSRDLAEKQIALYHLGVPIAGQSYGVQVRHGSGGVTRWPTVEELREMNPRDYGARDERNAERAASRQKIETGATDIEKIAPLVDELNLIAAELRAYVGDEATPSELARAVRDALTVRLDKEGRG